MKKLRKNGGFTLVEMLIVVAIIAILIAVTVPLVSSSLEKARHATDDANFRDAAGLGYITYLDESSDDDDYDGGTYYYCVSEDKVGGYLVEADAAPDEAYEAKCTCGEGGTTGAGTYITVTIDADETDPDKIVVTSWD